MPSCSATGRLQSLIYTDAKTDYLIGRIIPLDGGGARLWDGDLVPAPVADLAIIPTGIEVRPVAAEDKVCGNSAIVPNIFDVPITDARNELLSFGWEPVPQTLETEYGQEVDLHRLGVIETTGCSGTGFGYCGFSYRHGGISLSVVTAGEFEGAVGPSVVRYGVECQ